VVKNISTLGGVVLAYIAAGKVWNNQALRSSFDVSLLLSVSVLEAWSICQSRLYVLSNVIIKTMAL
jgi:hypothetical protein